MGVIVLVCLQAGCGTSARSYVERGNRLAAAGKYGDAELQYRNSISKDPKYAEAYFRLGLLEYELRHGMEALDDFERAVNFDNGNQTYAIELANVAVEAYQAAPSQKQLYEEAAEETDLLLKKDPESFDGLRLQGDLLVIDRKYDEALSEFGRANAIQPNNPDVILAMTQILLAQHKDREAEQLAQQFLSVRKDFSPIYDLLQAHYVRTKRFGDAEHLLRTEITSFPADARPQLQLASLYRTAGRYQDMSAVLTRLVSDRDHFSAGYGQVGDFYAEYQEWDKALIDYRTGLHESSSAADSLRYRKRVEQALEALGKREEAIAELDEILKADPKDPQMRLTRALLLGQSQDAKERGAGADELTSLATQYPENAVVHYQLGRLYLNRNNAASAWRELKKSADLRKDYIPPRLLLADIAQTAQKYPAAQQAADQVLALDPNNADAKLLRAAALVGNQSYPEARSELDALSKLQPNSKEVGLNLAALAAGEKDYPKAERLYRRFYQPGSADLRPLEGLVQLSVLQDHPEKAQSLLGNELRQQPDSRPVRLLLASIATREGRLDVAAQQYRWLQSQDPKSVQAYSALGDLYQRQGATESALASYEKARELAPNDIGVLNQLAVLESQAGQPQQAIATLNKQLALDPGNSAAMNNLAFDLADTGQDLDRALTLAQQVAQKFPNNPGVIDTLGWVYARRGLNASAIQALRVLVKKYPNEPAFRYHLAVALMQDKQSSDAKQELLAALSRHPSKNLSSKIQASLAQVH